MIPKVIRLPGFVVVDERGEPMAFNYGDGVYGCAIFQTETAAKNILQRHLREGDTSNKWWEVISCEYAVENQWGYEEKE